MDDYDRVVEDLAVRHREREALRLLMTAGFAASGAVKRGLRHPNPVVRAGCCRVLDHFLDESAIPDLMANLAHEDAEVRAWALHALACDRCKEGVCRPAEDETVPIAIRMLEEDPDRQVRKTAVGLIGAAVHRRPDVADALARARDNDPDAMVRKVAWWYAPGGPIYKRLAPKSRRIRSEMRLEAPASSTA
jgi:hypothetical protein